MTYKQAAEHALLVQDACNTSGIARGMIEAIDAIREKAKDPTDNVMEVRNHPIIQMFLMKLCELNGCGSTLDPAYDAAEAACKRIVEEN